MKRRTFFSTLLSITLLNKYLRELSIIQESKIFSFKYSICNEIFNGWSLDKISKFIKPLGYDSLEIAPYTICEDVSNLSPAKRLELKRLMEDNGVVCSGLHWLFVSPKGLHITTSDKNIRKKSWEYFKKLIDFCEEIGGKFLVLGSPQQRKSEGTSTKEAVINLKKGLLEIAPFAQKHNVLILLEPIAKDCDVIISMVEAVNLVKEINHPSIQTMLDIHHSINDPEPIDKLVYKYSQYIKHIHINELDGNIPGSGDTDFLPILNAIKNINYKHWISLEVFDFSSGPEKIAIDTMKYIKSIEKKLQLK